MFWAIIETRIKETKLPAAKIIALKIKCKKTIILLESKATFKFQREARPSGPMSFCSDMKIRVIVGLTFASFFSSLFLLFRQ